ncbi:MAG: HEAT repeat domain-containing protein [Myxococcota bacterium]
MRTKRLIALLGATLLLATTAGQTHAQSDRARANQDSAQDDERIRAIIAQLDSKERNDVRDGYLAMQEMGSDAQAATPTANRVLARGLPVDLATVALRALGRVGHPSSSKAIRPYLRHRHLDLRREAVKALIRTGGPEAKTGLRQALSDADGMVRGMAATGLGELQASEHIDALFAALDRNVPEAAASIGQLCRPEQCEKFASRTGAVAFDIMITGFDQILFRDAAQMPDDQKIRIIGRVRELGTGEANRFLKDVQARWPKDGSERVKKALDLAVQATLASPGGA